MSLPRVTIGKQTNEDMHSSFLAMCTMRHLYQSIQRKNPNSPVYFASKSDFPLPRFGKFYMNTLVEK